MTIDYDNSVTINIHKQWDGQTEEGVDFVIDGGWNDFDGYYIDSINFKNKIDNESGVINKITDEFLLNMNG
jgi:hypothetical protein